MKRTLGVICIVALCGTIYLFGRSGRISFTNSTGVREKNDITIVIDAGHGGIDPGKVGIHGELEKNINLAIALKLKAYLEAQGFEVIMTRETDEGLYKDSDENKKVQDMKNRLHIIESSNPELAISIHQNSYPDARVSGIQVFYYRDSKKGQKAAEHLQETMMGIMKPQKERCAKDNTSYYLLKKTSVPIVIVECGFLSNREEAYLLSEDDYQERMAWAIQLGIERFISQNK